MVSVGCKVIHKAFVANNSVLGKSIHALYNFNNNVANVHKIGRTVFLHNGVEDIIDRNVHVFIAFSECVKKYFLRLVVMSQAPGADIVLLRRHLTEMISAVLVLI